MFFHKIHSSNSKLILFAIFIVFCFTLLFLSAHSINSKPFGSLYASDNENVKHASATVYIENSAVLVYELKTNFLNADDIENISVDLENNMDRYFTSCNVSLVPSKLNEAGSSVKVELFPNDLNEDMETLKNNLTNYPDSIVFSVKTVDGGEYTFTNYTVL